MIQVEFLQYRAIYEDIDIMREYSQINK